MRPYSIKRRLIASVLLVEMLSALCVTGLAFVYERHARFHAFDIMLRGRADSLLGAVQDAGDEDDTVMLDGSEKNLPGRDLFEVWDEKDKVLGVSPNWDGVEGSKQLTKEFQRLQVGGRAYRAIRLDGLRVVDPGENGGVKRRVTILYASPLEPLWEAVRDAVVFYAFASVGLLAVTGIVMLWLLNRGLEPLSELAVDAAKVSVTSWDFAPSVRVRSTVELAPLATTLSTALKGLERSFVQQNRFIGDAAHELKTAVAVVKSSLQLLAMRPRSAQEYEAGLERCQLDCERMEEIVARMLTLARIESEAAAEIALRTTFATDVAKVVRATAEQFESITEMRGIVLEIFAADGLVADVEVEQLQLLCSNLILNAIQHSSHGGSIKVTTGAVGSFVELHIVDEGTGIEPEVLPFIFDRFYRSDPSRSRKTGGTGLGLAISKAIVERYKGMIEITSKLGQGTAVLVRLPIHRGTATGLVEEIEG